MIQAKKKAFQHHLDNYKPMKSEAHTYVNKRECSIRNIRNIFADQWLHKTFGRVIFNLPEKKIPKVSR